MLFSLKKNIRSVLLNKLSPSLFTLPAHRSSAPNFGWVRVTRSLAWCVCSIYGFWLPPLISWNSSYIYLYRITVDTYISKVGLHFASLPFLSRQFYIKAFSSADVYYLIISITRSSKSGVKHILFFFVLCCQFLWIVHLLLPLRYSLTLIYNKY
jgi:hypothetical protein